MALINCKECGKEVSSSAPVCPHCGKQQSPEGMSKGQGCGLIAVVCIVGLIALSYCGNHPSTEDKKAAPPELKGTVQIRDGVEFRVSNDNDFDWKDCSFAVNYKLFGTDGYTGTIGTIAAQSTGSIEAASLALDTGERFNPITHRANNAYMRCDVPNGKNSIGWEFKN